MIRVEFTQPAPLLNLNSREHWRPRARWTKEWRAVTAMHTIAAVGRRRPTLAPVVVQLYLPVRDKRRRDPHNFVPTLKACVDGIVDSGLVIPDDNSDWCTTLEPILVAGATTVVIEIRART